VRATDTSTNSRSFTQSHAPELQQNFSGKRMHDKQISHLKHKKRSSKYHYPDYRHYFQSSTNQSEKRNGYQKFIIILSVLTIPPSLLSTPSILISQR
jgi:hypothetical protein